MYFPGKVAGVDGVEVGVRSRLTKMWWERSREAGVELKTRGEAPQGRAEDWKTNNGTPGTEAMRG